jgi:hypothetical protein
MKDGREYCKGSLRRLSGLGGIKHRSRPTAIPRWRRACYPYPIYFALVEQSSTARARRAMALTPGRTTRGIAVDQGHLLPARAVEKAKVSRFVGKRGRVAEPEPFSLRLKQTVPEAANIRLDRYCLTVVQCRLWPHLRSRRTRCSVAFGSLPRGFVPRSARRPAALARLSSRIIPSASQDALARSHGGE